MRSRTPRQVTVGVTATQIRDTGALPVTRSILRYPSGGGDLYLSPSSGLTGATNGTEVQPDTDYVLEDQSLLFYAISTSGNITLTITDYEA